MRKPLFYHFRPIILASQINQKIMFFQSRFLELLFLICFQFCLKNCRIWDPSKIQWAPKWHQKSTKWRPKAEKSGPPLSKFSEPYFHETMVITVPLGHRGFYKRSLFRWRLANCRFLLRFAVLCFIQPFHHFLK